MDDECFESMQKLNARIVNKIRNKIIVLYIRIKGRVHVDFKKLSRYLELNLKRKQQNEETKLTLKSVGLRHEIPPRR